MLELLLGAGGAVVSTEEIFERVWDESLDPFSQAVKTTVSRLRTKLGDPPLIETVAKSGYRIPGMTTLHLPRRTVRLRLALLYGLLFLASGAVLLGVTYVLVRGSSGAITAHPTALGQQAPAPQAVAADQQTKDLNLLLFWSAIALAVMAVASVGSRLGGRRPHPEAAAGDHRDRTHDLGLEPARASRPRRPRR